MRQAHQAEDGVPFPSLEEHALPHVGDLRSMAGVNPPPLPGPYADRWSTPAESEFLAYGINEAIPGAVLTDVMTWYRQTYVGEGGRLPADAEARFREEFKGKLQPDQISRLVAWARRLHSLDGGGA